MRNESSSIFGLRIREMNECQTDVRGGPHTIGRCCLSLKSEISRMCIRRGYTPTERKYFAKSIDERSETRKKKTSKKSVPVAACLHACTEFIVSVFVCSFAFIQLADNAIHDRLKGGRLAINNVTGRGSTELQCNFCCWFVFGKCDSSRSFLANEEIASSLPSEKVPILGDDAFDRKFTEFECFAMRKSFENISSSKKQCLLAILGTKNARR